MNWTKAYPLPCDRCWQVKGVVYHDRECDDHKPQSPEPTSHKPHPATMIGRP